MLKVLNTGQWAVALCSMDVIRCLNQILLFALLQVKNAYTIAKLRKTGYSKKQFYQEAISMYKEVYNCYILYSIPSFIF